MEATHITSNPCSGKLGLLNEEDDNDDDKVISLTQGSLVANLILGIILLKRRYSKQLHIAGCTFIFIAVKGHAYGRVI